MGTHTYTCAHTHAHIYNTRAHTGGLRSSDGHALSAGGSGFMAGPGGLSLPRLSPGLLQTVRRLPRAQQLPGRQTGPSRVTTSDTVLPPRVEAQALGETPRT